MTTEQELAAMTEVAAQLHVVFVTEVYGDGAIPVLRALLRSINSLFRRVAPELQQGSIIVAKTLDDSPLDIDGKTPETLLSLDNLPLPLPPVIVIQALENGSFLVWKLEEADARALASTAIVYRFQKGIERFYARDK